MTDLHPMKLPALLSLATLVLLAPAYGSGASTHPALTLLDTIGERGLDAQHPPLRIPTDIALDGTRHIHVVNSAAHQILTFDFTGHFIRHFGARGSAPSEFYYPYSIDIDSQNRIYVSDLGNDRIQYFDRNGTYQGALPFTTGNVRLSPSGEVSVIRAHGDFDYAIDDEDLFSNDSNVQIFTLTGDTKHSLSPALAYKNGQMHIKGNEVHVDFDDAGNVVVVYAYRDLIEKYDSSGALLWKKTHPPNCAPSKPAENDTDTNAFREVQMNRCHSGIAIGPKGRIWVVTLARQLGPEERVTTDLRIMRGFDGRKKLTIDVSDYTGPPTVHAFQIDVLDRTGRLITSIPLTHFADNVRIFGNNLFVIDSFHKQEIYHYAISD